MSRDFLPSLTGSFAMPAAENPTVAMVEAAYRHHGLHWRYINCEVAPEKLGDAVRAARAMGWREFNFRRETAQGHEYAFSPRGG